MAENANVVSITPAQPLNERAVLAEAQAKFNADTIAAMQQAHAAERHELFEKMRRLTTERNAAQAALNTNRRVHPPAHIAARIYAFIFENMHDIVVDGSSTLGSLYDNELWNALGVAVEAIFRDIARGTAINRLCGNCRNTRCGGCGFDKNDNDGEFALPRALASELKAWRRE